MIALPLTHRAALMPAIAYPACCSERRVGVPVPASLPSCRQAVGRGAVVPAYPINREARR